MIKIITIIIICISNCKLIINIQEKKLLFITIRVCSKCSLNTIGKSKYLCKENTRNKHHKPNLLIQFKAKFGHCKAQQAP